MAYCNEYKQYYSYGVAIYLEALTGEYEEKEGRG